MLRALVSPDRKKLKTTGADAALPDSDEEEMYANSALKEDDGPDPRD